MADRIDLPPNLQGDEKAQLQQLWSYLYQMSQALNNNLDAIGGNELTDSERAVMQKILSGDEVSSGLSEMETLKSLIIKTADFVQTSLTEYRMNLLGSTVASGQFGRYVRNTGLDVEINPEGITQNFSFQEIVQGLKHYEINAKNYIKTGLLRTVGSLPVYGVAIGKDVVTYSEDGTETYVDGNKVAELTANELSFWQNGAKVAGYTGSRISFYYNGTECFYIQNGKMYAAADFEINNGKKLIIASGADMEVASGGDLNIKSGGKITVESGADLDVNSGGDLNIKSGGKVSVQSGGGLDVNSGGSVQIKSGGDFSVDAGTFNVNTSNLIIDSTGGSFATVNNLNVTGELFPFYIGSYSGGSTSYNYNGIIAPTERVISYNGIQYTSYPVSLQIRDKITVQGKTKTAIFNFGQSFHMIDNEVRCIPMLRISGVTYTGQTASNDDSGIYADYLFGTHVRTGWGSITTLNAATVYYNTLIQISSKDIKHNITDLPPVGEKLDLLRPVTFVYDADENETQRMGLIYEDTVEVMPEICTEDESNKAINYVELIPALLKEIQELRARVKALEEREE